MLKQYRSTALLIAVLSLSLSNTIPSRATSNQSDCPNLEERLVGLLHSAAPDQYAAQNGLYYEIDQEEEGWVRIVIELAKSQSVLPPAYAFTLRPEARHGNFVQALSRIPILCDLSFAPQVKYVRPALEPVLDDH